MKIEQIYTGCLSQGAYYVESEGEAVIIDPLRETESYIQKAAADGAQIKYVLETHFHADFVSGHVDLAQKTGATIVFGPGASTEFDSHIAADSEILTVGALKIKVLHTPGHTMESSSYLLFDESGNEYALFSGDTLFIGDVGRPDLAVKSNLSKEELAAHLFDSLRNRIMTLPDNIIVYPAHGAGSACGKNMSKNTFDRLGNQKLTNYALRADMTKKEFVKEVTEDLGEAPQYFPENVMLNKNGYESIDKVFERGMKSLTPHLFEVAANLNGALVLDTRSAQVFKDGFIFNSINIGIDGSFAPWVGTLVKGLSQPILLVVDEGREKEVLTRLARVGYDNVIGYLEGGIPTWKKAGKNVDSIVSVSADSFSQLMDNQKLNVLDVRKPNEYTSSHLPDALNYPLADINRYFRKLDKNKVYYIHCAGGYRSMIYSSVLKSRGFDKVVDIAGGFKAISETNLEVSETTCLSKLNSSI